MSTLHMSKMQLKTQIKDVIEWMKNPDDFPLEIAFIEKFKIFYRLLIIDLLIAVLLIPITFFIHYNILKLSIFIQYGTLIEILILAVLVAPVLEEFIFRFPLKKKRNYIFRFLSWITKKRFDNRWNYYKYFVYFLIFCFAFLHLTNYENTELLFFVLSPIIIGSQLIGGVFLSYVRIKCGFFWSVVLHMVFNLIVMVFCILLFHNYSTIDISNENVEFEMTSLFYVDTTQSSLELILDKDLIFTISAENIIMNTLIDSLKLDGCRAYDDFGIHITFDSRTGMSKNDFKDILDEHIILEIE